MGATYPQPFALLMLNAEIASSCASNAERKAALEAELKTHLKAVNAQLDDHEQLEFLAVVPEQWTVENGYITPTLKVKRPAIEAAYARYFEAWSAARKPVLWHATGD